MRHKSAQKLFSAALDQELSVRQRQRFEAHLEECPGCRREYELFALTHRLLGREEEGALSADFAEQLIGRLREARRQGRSAERGWYWQHLRLAAGAAALVLLFLWGDRVHTLPELRDRYQQSHEQRMESWSPYTGKTSGPG